MKQRDIEIPGWVSLGRPDPRDLTAARLELHWAVQVLAAVGRAHLPPAADDSHTSMSWLSDQAMLGGKLVPGPRPFRAALRPEDLSLHLLAGDASTARLSLGGRTLDEALEWMSRHIEVHTGQPPVPLEGPPYDLPEHPVAEGEAFRGEHTAELAELARWYANTHHALIWLEKTLDDAPPVRCWPHHLDMAGLLNLDAEGPDTGQAEDGSEARSIGIGMSPGDGNYEQPYFYVSPWPHPKDRELPPLPGGGTWHTGDWVGGILTGTRLVEVASAELQAERTAAFLQTAVEFCYQLLDLDL